MSTPLPTLAPPKSPRAVLAFGDGRVDACLPGGLPLGQVHEIAADGVAAETGGLVAAFAACWLARLPGAQPILWITPSADLYPPGLLEYGLNPARLLLAHSGGDTSTLAAMEAALRLGAAAAVVGEAGAVPRLAGRRLHLACLAQGCTGFVLRRWPYGVKPGAADVVAVATRWRLAAVPSVAVPSVAVSSVAAGREPGPARWQVDLTQARGGRPGSWLMEWHKGDSDAPGALRVVTGLADAAAALRRRA